MYPLHLAYLQEASTINTEKQQADASSSAIINKNKKRAVEEMDAQDPASQSAAAITASALPYLIWTQMQNGPNSVSFVESDKLHFRTGRWNEFETKYANFLIQLFENGALPLPNGIKCNEFLRDLLMCRSSRLTKKYKNAKLSNRLFTMNSYPLDMIRNKHFAHIQELFLAKTSKVTGLILRFNMSLMWRRYLNEVLNSINSRLSIVSQDWYESVDELETISAEYEQKVRQVRRCKMETALKCDSKGFVNHEEAGIFLKVSQVPSRPPTVPIPLAPQSLESVTSHVPSCVVSETSEFDIPHLSPMMPYNDQTQMQIQDKNGIFDFISPLTNDRHVQEDNEGAQINWDDLDIALGLDDTDNYSHSSGESFNTYYLTHIMALVRQHGLPFQYCDMWAPSQVITEERKNGAEHFLYLTHHGDALLPGQPPSLQLQLKEFGVYSRNFLFKGSAGMPGRVFSSNEASWERNVQSAPEQHFKRVGGARMSNINTVIGIPVSHAKLGTIVVAFYSIQDVEESHEIVEKLVQICGSVGVEDDRSRSTSISAESMHSINFAPKLFPTEVFSPDEITQLINILSAHIPIDDSKAKESPAFYAPVESFVSLRLLLLKPYTSYSKSEKELLEVLRQSWLGYVCQKFNEEDIANRIVREYVFLGKTYSSSTNEENRPVSTLPWRDMAHVDYDHVSKSGHSSFEATSNEYSIPNVQSGESHDSSMNLLFDPKIDESALEEW